MILSHGPETAWSKICALFLRSGSVRTTTCAGAEHSLLLSGFAISLLLCYHSFVIRVRPGVRPRGSTGICAGEDMGLSGECKPNRVAPLIEFRSRRGNLCRRLINLCVWGEDRPGGKLPVRRSIAARRSVEFVRVYTHRLRKSPIPLCAKWLVCASVTASK